MSIYGNFCRSTSTMVKYNIFSSFDPDMSMEISVDLPVPHGKM